MNARGRQAPLALLLVLGLPGCSAADAKTKPERASMVRVPEGYYRWGSDPKKDKGRYPGEESDDALEWVEPFWIDLYEYPNEKSVVPRNGVSWTEAASLCAARGKRLCEEHEWEAACEGPEGRIYGYGDKFDPAACDTGVDDEAGAAGPSGEHAACRSPAGVFDMAGGLAEWTAGSWKPGSSMKVARSGAFSSKPRVLRCANRIPKPAGEADAKYGFRCCADVDDAPARIPLPPDEAVPGGKLLESVTFGVIEAKAPPAGFDRCLAGPRNAGPIDDSTGPFDRLTWTWCGKPGKVATGFRPVEVLGPGGARVATDEVALRRLIPLGAGLALAVADAWSAESSGEADLVFFAGDRPIGIRRIETLEIGAEPAGRAYRFARGMIVVDYRAYQAVAGYEEPEGGYGDRTESCRHRVIVSDAREAVSLIDVSSKPKGKKCAAARVKGLTLSLGKTKRSYDGETWGP